MRTLCTPYLLTLLLICSFTLLQAQTLISKHSIYYESGRYSISKSARLEVLRLADSMKANSSLLLVLEGNTDNVGNEDYNKTLSQKRAAGLKQLLVSSGIEESMITSEGLGAGRPIAPNKTNAGRRLNRRVDILVFKKEELTTTQPAVENISTLYALLQTPLQSFCINPRKDTVLRCEQGTVIYIKANALSPTSACEGTCVRFNVKEALLKSDMVLDNLSTTSNGEIIETQGMIYTEASDCNGNKLGLKEGKDIVIVLPTDSIKATAKIFDGNRLHDSIMNWTVNNNSVLSNFTQSDLDICGGWMCVKPKTIDCEPCKFFFCRIGRIGKATAGLVSRTQRGRNRIFRQCQEELGKLDDSTTTLISSNPTTVLIRPPLEASLVPKCSELEALFKRYGITDIEGFITAINKPLVDSFKVKTVAQLRDTLEKVIKGKIELSYLNKKVSFEDFKYYIYNTSRMGWTNIDLFANIPPNDRSILKVAIRPELNIDCKLIFRNRRFVLPATHVGSMFQFAGVPRGEKAVIVAIKYEDQRPFLAMQEVTVDDKTFDVKFRELTLDQLKEALKLLD
jgi:hypothetical protein